MYGGNDFVEYEFSTWMGDDEEDVDLLYVIWGGSNLPNAGDRVMHIEFNDL